MKRLVAIAMLAVYGFATAQEQAERSVADAVPEPTMTLIPANTQTLAAVTAKIELPKDAKSGDVPSAQGVEHGARGLDEASAARENGRAFGDAAAAAARDNRENASRASRPVEEQGRPPAAEPSERR
jgi:biotin carboxylase